MMNLRRGSGIRPINITAGKALLICRWRWGIVVTMMMMMMMGSADQAAGDTSAGGGTVVGFYNQSCPSAEQVVQGVVAQLFGANNTLPAALLRMLFHDSFVRGVDASVMLDTVPGGSNETEKEAGPNLTLRGFDAIEAIKSAVEGVCPGIVSCADVLVLAVRDCVALAGGPQYVVGTGRLDGRVSLKEEALNLPSPSFPIEQVAEMFIEKGLTKQDMVTLLGAHTVGQALCGFFNDRLYNYHGTGLPDPEMNPSLLQTLIARCPNPFATESNLDPLVDLDQATPTIFDSSYFKEVLQGNGVLELDQEIAQDPAAASMAQSFTNPDNFFPAFVTSILKLGNIGVLTGSNPFGEVRRTCNSINHP